MALLPDKPDQPEQSGDDQQMVGLLFQQLQRYAHDLNQLMEQREKRDRIKRKALPPAQPFIGDSPGAIEVLQLCRKMARSEATVMIFGESGTGKDIIARLTHEWSPRRAEPYIALNCAAIPETLIDSTLFGHERGAFTDAVKDTAGCFEMASGGTLFLDEVGELSLTAQAKLLRVLEDGSFWRVGGRNLIAPDVRLLVATNRDLEQEVEAGRFRLDLYYRLNVLSLTIPPLRQRPEDIPALVEHFVERIARKMKVDKPTITSKTMDYLVKFDWPGNVRQLRNVVERCVVLAEGGKVLPEHLPERVLEQTQAGGESAKSSLERQEKQMLLEALRRTDWNKTAAARELGISWDQLRTRIKRYNLKKGQ